MSNLNINLENLPDYNSPPISEVVCGISFEPLVRQKIPHFGLFWNAIRDDFPKCEHAPPLADSDEEFQQANEIPLPRVWLINKSNNLLIQLQNNRFIYNWRRLKSDDSYPRFKEIYASFKQFLELYEQFVIENDLGNIKIRGCELSYVNHIKKGEGWDDSGQAGNIMKDISWVSERDFLPTPELFETRLVFSLPNNYGSLTSFLRKAKLKRDHEQQIYILELSAKGLGDGSDISNIDPWFDVSHEWIVKGFTDLTQEKIQNELWGKK